MATWFARHDAAEPVDPAVQPGPEPVPDRHTSKAEIDKAYERGRRQEHEKRRSSPLARLLFLVLVVAAIAAFIAYRYGSFTNAGAAADTALSSTAATAVAPVHQAADKAGDALQNAGQDLKQTAGSRSQ